MALDPAAGHAGGHGNDSGPGHAGLRRSQTALRLHQRQQLERKQGRRASYDRILIIPEGSKTDPNYFRETRAALRP